MPENSFYHPPARTLRLWDSFWMPGLLAFGLFLIDFYCIRGIFALPLLWMMLLIFLAFRLPAGMVALWTVVFAAVILCIRLMPIQEVVTLPALKPYVLTAIFLTSGTGAIVLAAFRRRLELGHEAIFRVISALPLAVIISDISGNILLLNEQAEQVLKNHVNKLAGLSYFSTFIGTHDQGKAIATYISYFAPDHVGTVTTTLRTRGEPALSLQATITVVTIGRHRYAITVVERVEPVLVSA